ncbi:MAG: UDP-glucose/GDP-mannose dehydrogenase family protein [Spirochaetales bacterium]|nr:UDP-glucose/GDP-mannose dehydrogenase family protein [Spirochaetales bacterium]
MKIAMVGTGYVGLVTGTCFAQMGNTVTCVDVDAEKISGLKKGLVPIYEPGLEAMVVENSHLGTLKFTTSLKEALVDAEVCFIAVGTPMGADGSADLRYVLKVAEQIGENAVRPLVVVDKSTVPVGTADQVKAVIAAGFQKRGFKGDFWVVSNPEFLKEGAAIDDFMKPDRVIVGAEDAKPLAVMRELYKPFTFSHDRFIEMDVRSAEMTKYAANAMLATKISFMNEIANICEKVGADVNKVRVGIGSDSRIGYSFIYPGCGYGGSCFPKDVRALEKTARDVGYTPRILSAVEAVNADQKKVLPTKVVARFGDNLKGKTFAVWGLAFKPETDDMREASSVTLIQDLLARGALVKAYDPKAEGEAKKHYWPSEQALTFCSSKYEAASGADALLLVTEWKEFRSPDFDELAKSLKNKVIFDGRNQYSAARLAELGFEYYAIGVGK